MLKWISNHLTVDLLSSYGACWYIYTHVCILLLKDNHIIHTPFHKLLLVCLNFWSTCLMVCLMYATWAFIITLIYGSLVTKAHVSRLWVKYCDCHIWKGTKQVNCQRWTNTTASIYCICCTYLNNTHIYKQKANLSFFSKAKINFCSNNQVFYCADNSYFFKFCNI